MGYIITIIVSMIWAQGYYSACVPSLIEAMGNEINAVILQTIVWKNKIKKLNEKIK